MTVLVAVRECVGAKHRRHDCTGAGCEGTITKDGASFSLKNAPAPHILMDFDKSCDGNCGDECFQVGPRDSRCDWLFVADGAESRSAHVVPIEVTSGTKNAETIRTQLQAGAQFAEKVLPESGVSVKFRPVFVGKCNKADKMDLKKESYRVKYRGQQEFIKIITNGSNLAGALKV